MNLRSLHAIAAASALVLTLGACGSDSGDPGASSGGAAGADLDLVTDGSLTVCSDVPYAPFEDFDEGSDLGYKGFDVDITNAIAKGLGLKLVYKDSSFDGLQSGLALNAGQCDIAASAMTITEDRKKNIAFSDGYYDSKQSLLVGKDSGIKAIGDLSGKKVGVQQGTTGKTYAEENAKGANLVSFPSDAEMWQAMQAGQVDALLQDLPVNVPHTESGDFTIVEEYSTDEQYGLAMKKGNDALVKAVNEQLKAIRDNGDYDKFYNTYFTEGGDDAAATS